MTETAPVDPRLGGLGDPIGTWRPISVAPQRLDILAKMLGMNPKRWRSVNLSKPDDTSKENPMNSSQQKEELGFLHYRAIMNPAESGKKRLLDVTIIEASDLEQGYIGRYPYVKVIYNDHTWKTTSSPKSTSSPLWGETFVIELDDDYTVTPVTMEVWATRAVGADLLIGRIGFFPGTDPIDLWQDLWLKSSSVEAQFEVTREMMKWQVRVAKRARDRQPELLLEKRMAIRKKKAATIQAQKDAIVAAGWGKALEPVRDKKELSRIPVAVSSQFQVAGIIGFLILLVIIFAIPGEIVSFSNW